MQDGPDCASTGSTGSSNTRMLRGFLPGLFWLPHKLVHSQLSGCGVSTCPPQVFCFFGVGGGIFQAPLLYEAEEIENTL